jgi:hypothetical protein
MARFPGVPMLYIVSSTRSIAQFGSAPALGAGGRRFESYYSDQLAPEALLAMLRICNPRIAGSIPAGGTNIMQTLKQIMWSIWLTVCFVLVFSAGWSSHYWLTKHVQDNDHTGLCENQRYRTAWLAKKNGEYRCFQEYNQWPRRAYGYTLPYEPEDHYPTPYHFIQGKLRFDFQEETIPLP